MRLTLRRTKRATTRLKVRGDHSLRTSALQVGAVTALASLVALARDVVVSRNAGFGLELDTWSLAIAWTTVGMSALVSGIGAAVVPFFGRQDRHPDRPGTPIDVLGAVALTSTVLAGALWFSAAPIAQLLAPSAAQPRLESVLRVMSVLVVVPAAVRGTAAALLQARRHFVVPGALALVTYSSVIIAAVTGTVTARRLAVAHGIGIIAEAAVLAALLWRTRDTKAGSVAGLRTMFKTFRRPVATTAVASLLFGAGPVIDLWFAGRVGEGKAGQLALAARIPLAVAALLTTAFATPAFSVIVDRAADGARGAFEAADRVARSTLRVTVGCSIAVVVLSIPTASVAFTGSEVTADQSRSVALVQMVYALAIPVYVAGTIQSRGLQAIGRHESVLWVGLAGAIVNALLNWALSGPLGLHGIALSTVAVYTMTLTGMRLRLARLAGHADHIRR